MTASTINDYSLQYNRYYYYNNLQVTVVFSTLASVYLQFEYYGCLWWFLWLCCSPTNQLSRLFSITDAIDQHDDQHTLPLWSLVDRIRSTFVLHRPTGPRMSNDTDLPSTTSTTTTTIILRRAKLEYEIPI